VSLRQKTSCSIPCSRPNSPAKRGLVAESLTYWDPRACRLAAWVVMNDHIDVVAAPRNGVQLETLLRSWNSYTATRMVRGHGRAGPVWQREFYDRVIRGDGEFQKLIEYVCHNPWKRWPELKAYRWVWPQPRWRSLGMPARDGEDEGAVNSAGPEGAHPARHCGASRAGLTADCPTP
jgi:hypothetical protein